MKTSISNKHCSAVLILIFMGCSFFFISTGQAAETVQTAETEQAAETQQKTDPRKTEDASLHIVSDKMIAKRSSSMVEFIGNVKATRLDSIVFADSIQVFFNENASKKRKTGDTGQDQGKAGDPDKKVNDNVKKIIATGNVRYTAGERKAFSDKAVYTTDNEVLVLTGKSPKLVTGTSFVTGKKITLYRIEDKVIVESDGSRRVEALFNPEDNKKKNEDKKK